MKATLLLIGIIVTLSLLTSCNETSLDEEVVPATVQAVEDQDFFLEEGALLGLHYAIHKEESSLPASRNFLRYDFFPAWKDLCPGSQVFYLRPDRGPHIGQEGFFWVFQNKEARDIYFPAEDFPSEEFENRRASVDWLYTDSTFFKHFQFGLNTSGFSSDYEVIAMHDSVDKEWFADDAMIVIQHYSLIEGTDTLALENFLGEEWAATESKINDDAVTAFIKVTRGYRKGEFAQLWVFNSLQARNDLFPYEGIPSEGQNMEETPIQQKLKTFVDFTDISEAHYEVIY